MSVQIHIAFFTLHFSELGFEKKELSFTVHYFKFQLFFQFKDLDVIHSSK